eukprot:COSAG01_NODE_3731_length_5755_cov_6.626414_6_plen_200_part_00
MPIAYAQLDPWAWAGYVETAEIQGSDGRPQWIGAGKLVSWTPEPKYFPGGFGGFAEAGSAATFGGKPMPLLLYSLWWEPNQTRSYYGPQYDFVESTPRYRYVNGTMQTRHYAQPAPQSAHRFYTRVMADHRQHLGGFEIDFLYFTALLFPDFYETVDGLHLWAAGMNSAALSQNVSIQYLRRGPHKATMPTSHDGPASQ